MQVDRQVTRYRRAWEDHNLWTLRDLHTAKQTEKPFLLVALGDLAAQGVGAKTVEQGYVPRLAASVSGALNRPVALLNLSVSGATVETVLTHQLPLLEGLGLAVPEDQPDMVVANIGGNDALLDSLTPNLFRDYLHQVVGELPVGSLIGNVPSFSVLGVERKAEELSAIVDEEANVHGHLPVDLRSLTLSYNPTDYVVRYHAADLFHPNSRAYSQWSELFLHRWLEAEGHQRSEQAPPQWRMRTVRHETAERSTKDK